MDSCEGGVSSDTGGGSSSFSNDTNCVSFSNDANCASFSNYTNCEAHVSSPDDLDDMSTGQGNSEPFSSTEAYSRSKQTHNVSIGGSTGIRETYGKSIACCLVVIIIVIIIIIVVTYWAT